MNSTAAIEVLSTAAKTYASLHNSGNVTWRKSEVVLAKLPCGARIVVKLPRSNDSTNRLKVGFSKDAFSKVHFTGTISGFASSVEDTVAELKYVLINLEAFKAASAN